MASVFPQKRTPLGLDPWSVLLVKQDSAIWWSHKDAFKSRASNWNSWREKCHLQPETAGALQTAPTLWVFKLLAQTIPWVSNGFFWYVLMLELWQTLLFADPVGKGQVHDIRSSLGRKQWKPSRDKANSLPRAGETKKSWYKPTKLY